MESYMFAAMLLQPTWLIGAGMLALVSCVAVYALVPRASSIAPVRVMGGYLGAIFACALMAAVAGYVPPNEAEAIWHVPAEAYWTAVGKQVLVMFILLSYFAVVGVALVGVPTIFILNSRHRASVPWVALTATIISLCALIVLSFFSHQGDQPSLTSIALLLVSSHLCIAIGFSVGARLPWRFHAPQA